MGVVPSRKAVRGVSRLAPKTGSHLFRRPLMACRSLTGDWYAALDSPMRALNRLCARGPRKACACGRNSSHHKFLHTLGIDRHR